MAPLKKDPADSLAIASEHLWNTFCSRPRRKNCKWPQSRLSVAGISSGLTEVDRGRLPRRSLPTRSIAFCKRKVRKIHQSISNSPYPLGTVTTTIPCGFRCLKLSRSRVSGSLTCSSTSERITTSKGANQVRDCRPQEPSIRHRERQSLGMLDRGSVQINSSDI